VVTVGSERAKQRPWVRLPRSWAIEIPIRCVRPGAGEGPAPPIDGASCSSDRGRGGIRSGVENSSELCRMSWCAAPLLVRVLVRGRAAKDPAARHGLYCGWGRMEYGCQVRSFIPADEAPNLHEAIKAYRRVHTLLQRWERESVQVFKTEAPQVVSRTRHKLAGNAFQTCGCESSHLH